MDLAGRPVRHAGHSGELGHRRVDPVQFHRGCAECDLQCAADRVGSGSFGCSGSGYSGRDQADCECRQPARSGHGDFLSRRRPAGDLASPRRGSGCIRHDLQGRLRLRQCGDRYLHRPLDAGDAERRRTRHLLERSRSRAPPRSPTLLPRSRTRSTRASSPCWARSSTR